MTHDQPNQPASRQRLAERIASPIAYIASSYISIVGLLLLFSINRIGRLTSPHTGDIS